jgi:hypothetical protein
VTVVRKVENQQGSPFAIKIEISTIDIVVIGIAATDEVRWRIVHDSIRSVEDNLLTITPLKALPG